MLVLDPSERISAELALKHSFVAEFADPTDEPVLELPLAYGDENLSLERLRELVWAELQSFSRPR